MKMIYDKLNFYLNDICKHLEKENSFLLENIDPICQINDIFLMFIEKYDLNLNIIQNNLTFQNVFDISREIIKNIDTDYLKKFDNLINSGELDFSYEKFYEDSVCISWYKNGYVEKQIININREFNYNDVKLLIHEFIHYTNATQNTINRNYFSEFLSIYFENYAVNYLLNNNINKNEIDYLERIRSTKRHSYIFFQYEIILLTYIKFGNISNTSFELLKNYFLIMKKEHFDKECLKLYKNLRIIEKNNINVLNKNPECLGAILSDSFLAYNYKYILGTLLAIYAKKYSELSDVVYLNNHINEFDDKTVSDICQNLNIDISSKEFISNLMDAVSEYLEGFTKKFVIYSYKRVKT